MAGENFFAEHLSVLVTEEWLIKPSSVVKGGVK